MHNVSPIDVFGMEVSNEGITLLTKGAPLRNPPVFPAQPARFHPRINPISAPQTGLWQQSSKSFALRDQGHLVFTFTSMDSELKRWEARQQLILMCWKAMSDRSGNLHQTSQPDLGSHV
jgi:hypothetical protein